MLEYKLIRSKRRKTIVLQVRQGHVTVRAPHHITTALIDAFVEKKSAWLLKKLAEQQEKANFCDFSQDASLLFLGEQLTLNICVAKQANIFIGNIFIGNSLTNDHLANDNLINDIESFTAYKQSLRQLNIVIRESINNRLAEPLVKAKQVKKQLENYFKQQAEQLIIERLELISKQTALVPSKINIRQYRARWGSCNNRGEVSFNYLLMMTPCYVIDYVIVHELCHLEHLNHSKEFWQLVEKHSPNYQIAKNWLNTHQAQLHWQNPS